MSSFIELLNSVLTPFAALNILAAMYFHYRYIVGPSSTRNYQNAVFHWAFSGFVVALAVAVPYVAALDNALSGPATFVIMVGALTAPVVPILFLRKVRSERTPTIFDEIAMDDIIDRARNTREKN